MNSPIASVESSCEQRFIVHFHGDVDLETGKSQLINQISNSAIQVIPRTQINKKTASYALTAGHCVALENEINKLKINLGKQIRSIEDDSKMTAIR